MGGDFVEDAVNLGLVGRWRGGAGSVGRTLGDILLQVVPEAAKKGILKELVDVEEAGKGSGEMGGIGDIGARSAGDEKKLYDGDAGDDFPGHGGDGEKQDQDGHFSAWIEGGEGSEDAEDGAGGSNADGRRIGRKPEPAEAAKDAA